MSKEYECEQIPVILYVPSNSVKLTITAKVIDENDEFLEAQSVLNLPDIIEACIPGKEWEDENTVYTLTDKDREELKNEKIY